MNTRSIRTSLAAALFGAALFAAGAANAGSWTYDGTDRITHDSGWVLKVTASNMNLTVFDVFDEPASPSALPLNDAIDDGYRITAINEQAFMGRSMTSVTIPGSVTSIGNSVFSSCANLASVTLPTSITSIGDAAFAGCESLPSVMIGGTMIDIGGYLFSGCSILESVTISGSVASIADTAFAYCDTLTSLTFECGYPSGSVGGNLFEDSPAVTVYIHEKYAESWAENLGISISSLKAGNATWQGCPISIIGNAGPTPTPTPTTPSAPAPASPNYLSTAANKPGVIPIATTAYAGFAYDDDDGMVRGTVTLSAKAAVKKGVTNWTFTAKAILPDGTVSFSGKEWVDVAAGTLSLTSQTKETLAVTLSEGVLAGTLSGGKVVGTLRIAGAKDVFADKKDAEAAEQLAKLKGYYTVALISGEDGAPAGYLTLTIGNAGSVKIAGKLSDGTSVSASTKMQDGLNKDGWLAIALNKALYSKKGSIGGLLWLDPESKILRVDSANDWYIDWICHDPAKGEFNRLLDICGGKYDQAKALTATDYLFTARVPDILPLPAGLADDVTWIWNAIPRDVPVKYASGSLTMEKGVAPKKPDYTLDLVNPSCATIGYAPKTGIFKGGFKLYYAGESVQHKAISFSYIGILTPTCAAAYASGPVGFGVATATINSKKESVPVELSVK